MLTIWGRRNSLNVQKVMWTVGEIGLPYERRDVGGTFGGTSSAEYDQLNPNRVIPTIEDNGTIIWESNAIVRYLAARYDKGGLWPEDPVQRAGADQWTDWMQTTLIPALTTVFVGMTWTTPEKRDNVAMNKAAEKTGALFGRLDNHLADRVFVAGDTLTMGDIPLGAACYRYFSLDINRPQLPYLNEWYERLAAREAYQKHVMIPFGSSLSEWQALEQAGKGK